MRQCPLSVALRIHLPLRLSEVCQLQLKDIDTQREMIHIRNSKNNKDRLVPLIRRIAVLLGLPQKVNNINIDGSFEGKKVADIISKCKESAYFTKKSLHLYDPLYTR